MFFLKIFPALTRQISRGLIELNKNMTPLTCSKVETSNLKIKFLLLYCGAREFVEEPSDGKYDRNVTPVVDKLVLLDAKSKMEDSKSDLAWREKQGLELLRNRMCTIIYMSLSLEFKFYPVQSKEPKLGNFYIIVLSQHYEQEWFSCLMFYSKQNICLEKI